MSVFQVLQVGDYLHSCVQAVVAQLTLGAIAHIELRYGLCAIPMDVQCSFFLYLSELIFKHPFQATVAHLVLLEKNMSTIFKT